ncbi:MAG: rRNA maturation RNase YbeY [Treponema sp.]|uniref:rRNA maturation RNase YbeY n=1 Tax=Treponema sp. TaxID=166 RepID=UPI00298D83EE|nr:rRNA maturation RNase YbeY [Treponema sp.]MCR5386918.1 rRNA maturation RNase YbeY [Treponema sp.]
MANRILVSVQENLETPSWFEKVEDFISLAMKKLKFDGEEVSVMFVDDEYIKVLNKEYRNIDAATDVLSFEADGEYEDDEGKWKTVGDIAISIEMIRENAEYFEITENDELKRLLVHGLLHLNGMDHGEEHIEKGVKPECEMLVLQEKILDELKDETIIES